MITEISNFSCNILNSRFKLLVDMKWSTLKIRLSVLHFYTRAASQKIPQQPAVTVTQVTANHSQRPISCCVN